MFYVHWDLIVSLTFDSNSFSSSKSVPFRFQSFWMEQENFKEVVTNAWKYNADLNPVHSKLGNIGDLSFALKRWNKTKVLSLLHQIKIIKDPLLHTQLALQKFL